MTTTNGQLLNFINGEWKKSSAGNVADIINPATAKVLTHVPLSPGAEVDAAVQAGQAAFVEWKRDAGR
ncbi:MAG: aldehyde dehydrogenase family protein [Caldilineaceae bacterium]